MSFFVLFVPIAAGVALSKDRYDQHAALNRGFVQDIAKLPTRSGSMAAKTSNNPVIPPAALGADLGRARVRATVPESARLAIRTGFDREWRDRPGESGAADGG